MSLHGYIRNTTSDTEVHAEHHLRVTGVPDKWKRTYRSTQNSRSSPEPLEWVP